MSKTKHIAVRGGFFFVELIIAIIGVWNGIHPWLMMITIVALMIVAFIHTLCDDFMKSQEKKQSFKPKTSKENETKNRIA